MPWAQSSPLGRHPAICKCLNIADWGGLGGIDDPGLIISLSCNAVEPKGTLSCKDLAAA